MKASQNLPEVRREAVRHDGGPTSGAGNDNLVIENLAEFAAGGVLGMCGGGSCWADYVAPLVPAA